MKKLKIVFLSCLTMLFCLSFTSCNGCAGTGTQPDSDVSVEQEIEETSITLDKTSLLLTIGDEERLFPSVTGMGERITYTSDNTAVAVVDEYGLITALSEGTTVIHASYGEKTDTCEVTVGLGGMRPSLELLQIENDYARVAMGDVLSLEGQIQFNGKYFNDLQVNYTLSDPSVGTVTEENVFTPIKVGETSVCISATWRGIQDEVTLTKQITIKVQNDVALYVNDGATVYTLYTLGELQGKTYSTSMDFQAKVTVNGIAVQAETNVKEGEDIVDFNGNTVTALKYGKAVISVSYQDGTDFYEREVTINVLRPVGVYSETINYFSALDGELPINNIFGSNVDLVCAEQNGEALTVTDNKVLGVKTNRDSVTNTKILVYTHDRGYEVSLLAYTKVLNDAEDLRSLAATEENPIVDGYFYLANDIESETRENFHTAYWPDTTKTTNDSYGFKGIFEGNGHVINYVFSEVGLFGNLLDAAMVRNVALVATFEEVKNAKITPSALARNSGISVKIENVYARIKNNTANSARNTVLIGTRSASLELNSVIVENNTMSLTKVGGALFFADMARKTDTSQNKLNNVYVISSYPFMARWEDKKCIYANNDTADSAYTTEEKTITNYTGVKRYNSYQEMSVSGATYKDFNETYWDLSLGIPIWKPLFAEYENQFDMSTLPIETYAQTIEFSALDGELPLTEIFGEEVMLLQAYQGTNRLTVSNNKVLGLHTERDGVTETQITVFTAEKGFEINVNAYTKILDEASDFDVFDLSTGKTINGYYYLKNDVKLTKAFTHEAYWEKASGKLTFDTTIGFNGVFEGNGHTVEYPFNEWGLFGQILGDATIKNVKFVATRNAEESGVETSNGALARSTYGGEITNVYMQIIDTLSTPKRNAGMIGLRYYDNDSYGYTVLTNVIIEAPNSNAELRGGVIFDTDSARNLKEQLQDSNVYVISAHQCMTKWTKDPTTNMCFASNDNYTASGATLVKYSGVARYDSVNAMSASVTVVGNWKINAGNISWVNAT